MDVYQIADTPNFEVDTLKGDGISPITALDCTVSVIALPSLAPVSGAPNHVISLGEVFVSIPPNMTQTPGAYRATARIQLDSTPLFRSFTYDYIILALGASPPYPFTFGYCQLDDVKENVAGWNPNLPTTSPSAATVNGWIQQGAAMIDSGLAARGYYIPLRMIPGFPFGAIMPQAYSMLQMINASWATHFLEASRHGSKGEQADDNAKHWMEIFDDFMVRLESAADNLSAFGVDGAFEPEIDPSKGIDSGSFGAFVADPNADPQTQETAIFSKNMQF